jgi:hypothetical protein
MSSKDKSLFSPVSHAFARAADGLCAIERVSHAIASVIAIGVGQRRFACAQASEKHGTTHSQHFLSSSQQLHGVVEGIPMQHIALTLGKTAHCAEACEGERTVQKHLTRSGSPCNGHHRHP